MGRFSRSLRKFGAFVKVPDQPIAVYDCNPPKEDKLGCDDLIIMDGFTEPWEPGEMLPEWALVFLTELEDANPEDVIDTKPYDWAANEDDYEQRQQRWRDKVDMRSHQFPTPVVQDDHGRLPFSTEYPNDLPWSQHRWDAFAHCNTRAGLKERLRFFGRW